MRLKLLPLRAIRSRPSSVLLHRCAATEPAASCSMASNTRRVLAGNDFVSLLNRLSSHFPSGKWPSNDQGNSAYSRSRGCPLSDPRSPLHQIPRRKDSLALKGPIVLHYRFSGLGAVWNEITPRG
jgi:hypothetical protein